MTFRRNVEKVDAHRYRVRKEVDGKVYKRTLRTRENAEAWLAQLEARLYGLHSRNPVPTLKWQEAVKDLRAARDPIEAEFFAAQASTDAKALALYRKNSGQAARFLTDLTRARMERVLNMYRDLRGTLLTKYTNSTY